MEKEDAIANVILTLTALCPASPNLAFGVVRFRYGGRLRSVLGEPVGSSGKNLAGGRKGKEGEGDDGLGRELHGLHVVQKIIFQLSSLESRKNEYFI